MRWALGLGSAVLAGTMVLACGGSTSGGGAQDGGAGIGGSATGGTAGLGGFGGTVTGGSGGLGGTGGLGGFGGTGGTVEQEPTAHPPPDPGGPPAGGSQVDALVVQKLFLGELDRQGLIDPYAWKSYGYDLDGYYSNEYSTLHCTPVTGANSVSVKTDGNGGIDNSFGANLIPILKVFVPNPTNVASGAIYDGGETYLFRFVGLGPGPDQSPVSAGFLVSAKHPWAPAWDGKDSWWISSLSVNGSPDSPKLLLPSYVGSGTWVAHGHHSVSESTLVARDSRRADHRRAIREWERPGREEWDYRGSAGPGGACRSAREDGWRGRTEFVRQVAI
jgi:hypothetical protein